MSMTKKQAVEITERLDKILASVEDLEVGKDASEETHRELEIIHLTLIDLRKEWDSINRNLVIAQKALQSKPPVSERAKAISLTEPPALEKQPKSLPQSEGEDWVMYQFRLIRGIANRIEALPDMTKAMDVLHGIANEVASFDDMLYEAVAEKQKPVSVPAEEVDQATFALMHRKYDAQAARMNVMMSDPYKVEWYIHGESVRFLLRKHSTVIAGFAYEERDQIERFARDHNSNKE